MCMGTVADKTMGMMGSVLDVTGKLGIKDKFNEWGGDAKSKLSEVGQSAGINPRIAAGPQVQGPQQIETRASRQGSALLK